MWDRPTRAQVRGGRGTAWSRTWCAAGCRPSTRRGWRDAESDVHRYSALFIPPITRDDDVPDGLLS